MGKPLAFDPAKVSAETLRLNPHLFGGAAQIASCSSRAATPEARPTPAKKEKPEKQPNQTEREYALILKRQYPSAEIRYERYKLRIAVGCWYIPDFAVEFPDGRMEFHEVKGAFIFSKALTKPKAAAEMFPQRFWLAQKARKKDGGEWTVTELPGRATRLLTTTL